MTAPVKGFTNFPKKAMEAALALGTLKCILATATYTPDQDAHVYASSITNEASGTSYTAGGLTVTGGTVLIDTSTNKLTIDADDITTAGLSVSCRWGLLFIYTGSLATSPLIGYVDLSEGVGGNVTVTGVAWNAAGILPWTVA